MCNSKRANVFCSKLSDYDDLCGRVSERHRLKGFYRALMSTSTQWLSNFFSKICVNAKFVNIHVSFYYNRFSFQIDACLFRNKLCLIHSKKCLNKNHHKMNFLM
jgi:hypothetical protein